MTKLSTDLVDNSVNNLRASSETQPATPLYGSLVNSKPRGEANWVAIAIVIAAMLFICSPIVFVFMELK